MISLAGRSLQVGKYRLIAGIDEVGRGPLAGPVVAAAVVLDESVRIDGLDDSKKLTEKTRDRLAEEIRQQALGAAKGHQRWP